MGVGPYKHSWQLFSQEQKAPSCQNTLPLGAAKELIPTISQGTMGSGSSDCPVFTAACTERLRPALLDSPSPSGQALDMY